MTVGSLFIYLAELTVGEETSAEGFSITNVVCSDSLCCEIE